MTEDLLTSWKASRKTTRVTTWLASHASTMRTTRRIMKRCRRTSRSMDVAMTAASESFPQTRSKQIPKIVLLRCTLLSGKTQAKYAKTRTPGKCGSEMIDNQSSSSILKTLTISSRSCTKILARSSTHSVTFSRSGQGRLPSW